MRSIIDWTASRGAPEPKLCGGEHGCGLVCGNRKHQLRLRVHPRQRSDARGALLRLHLFLWVKPSSGQCTQWPLPSVSRQSHSHARNLFYPGFSLRAIVGLASLSQAARAIRRWTGSAHWTRRLGAAVGSAPAPPPHSRRRHVTTPSSSYFCLSIRSPHYLTPARIISRARIDESPKLN